MDNIFNKIARKSSRSLVGLLILGLMVTGLLVGCETKEEDLTDSLYDLKTPYVGDNSNLSSIVSSLVFDDGYEYESLEILSGEEPYGIKIFLKGDLHRDKNNFLYDSVLVFSLVDNLDQITFIGGNLEEIKISRQEADSFIKSISGRTCREVAKSKSEFRGFMEYYENYKASQNIYQAVDTSSLKKEVRMVRGMLDKYIPGKIFTRDELQPYRHVINNNSIL